MLRRTETNPLDPFRLTAIALLILGVAGPEAIGALTDGYHPQADYISELGATGAPFAAIVNYGLFLPIGVLFAAAAGFVWRRWPGKRRPSFAALLLLGVSVSYVGAAFFACDPGCPSEGSGSQLLHNAFGIVGYLTAPPALALLAAAAFAHGRHLLGALTSAATAAFVAGFLAMAADDNGLLLGAWQRLADYGLFTWMFLSSLALGGADRRAVQ